MTWIITGEQPFPAVIGEPFGGGYFAGYISHTADGNPTHALIVAPREAGYNSLSSIKYKLVNTSTPGAVSSFDGVINTNAMIADDVNTGIQNHPAAQYCANLDIGGFTDWYFPSRYELDIAYFNLKPSTTPNSTSWGINDYSVPKRTINNTLTYPVQTSVTAFTTSLQAFINEFQWSSTENNGDGWAYSFDTGSQVAIPKTLNYRVRAFRRIAL
jgi:hypothetical protein